MKKLIIIYITHKNLEEAKKIGNMLLKEKLIACANYSPIKSSYFWNWSIENDDEYVSILKTKSWNWKVVKNKVLENHPYETPCVMKVDVSANKEFIDWVYDQVSSK